MKKILLMVGLSVLATASFARGGHGGGHGSGHSSSHSHTSSYSSQPSHSTSFSSYSSSKGSTNSKETSSVRSSHGGGGSNDCDKKDRYGKPVNKNCQTM